MTTIKDHRTALSDVSLTDEGFLVAKATIARTGIQTYKGRELGLRDQRSNQDFRVFRAEAEVFDPASMASFASKPVTDDHPAELVNSRNARGLTRGFTGDHVTRDGNLLGTTITITDQELIDSVQTGKRETSNGYEADLNFTDGTTPGGEAFDVSMSNIRGNHVAIVHTGRCGWECRIGDNASCQCGECVCGQNGAEKVNDKTVTLKSVTVDGITIETTDQAAQVIDKLQRQVADGHTATATLQTKLDDAVKLHDKALGEKDGEIKKLTDAAVKPEDLDAMVADRQDIASKAMSIDDSIDCVGKKVEDIRRETVAKATGQDMNDKSDDYVEALFDTLLSNVKQRDPLRDSINSGPAGGNNPRATAYDARVTSVSEQWKTPRGLPQTQGAQS